MPLDHFTLAARGTLGTRRYHAQILNLAGKSVNILTAALATRVREFEGLELAACCRMRLPGPVTRRPSRAAYFQGIPTGCAKARMPALGQHRRHSGVALRHGALVGGPLADAPEVRADMWET